MLKFEEVYTKELNNGYHMAAGVAVGILLIAVVAT